MYRATPPHETTPDDTANCVANLIRDNSDLGQFGPYLDLIYDSDFGQFRLVDWDLAFGCS